MQYKKIYIEITNCCNLNCHFCAKTTRPPRFMKKKDFLVILDKIKDFTKYIYLHVMGEPLLHPEINQFIKLATIKGFSVNVTTNGSLLKKLNNDTSLRQINISLHALKEYKRGEKLIKELYKIFEKSEKLASQGVYINYRVWRSNNLDIINLLEKRYNTSIDLNTKKSILAKNVFYSSEKEFIWPIIKTGNLSSIGTCRALKDHIAILVDGSIVPCCLDNNATILLGNIYKTSLDKIINSSLYNNLLKGFNENKKVHNLCQNCDFYHKN